MAFDMRLMVHLKIVDLTHLIKLLNQKEKEREKPELSPRRISNDKEIQKCIPYIAEKESKGPKTIKHVVLDFYGLLLNHLYSVLFIYLFFIAILHIKPSLNVHQTKA